MMMCTTSTNTITTSYSFNTTHVSLPFSPSLVLLLCKILFLYQRRGRWPPPTFISLYVLYCQSLKLFSISSTSPYLLKSSCFSYRWRKRWLVSFLSALLIPFSPTSLLQLKLFLFLSVKRKITCTPSSNLLTSPIIIHQHPSLPSLLRLLYLCHPFNPSLYPLILSLILILSYLISSHLLSLPFFVYCTSRDPSNPLHLFILSLILIFPYLLLCSYLLSLPFFAYCTSRDPSNASLIFAANSPHHHIARDQGTR